MAIKEKLRWVVETITGSKEDEAPVKQTSVREVFLDAHKHFALGRKLGEKIALENAASLDHLTGLGMGGSMHPFFILQTYLENRWKKPIFLVRNYSIPQSISKKGFLIFISYSGNTEEPVAAYKEAYRKGYRMLVIASGGKLKDLAQQHGTLCIDLPGGYQPRMSFYIIFGCLLQILQNSGIIQDLDKEAEHIDAILRKTMFEDMGKQLATKIGKDVPLIYTTEKFGRIGERWKIAFNENAKRHAFTNQIPELNHNELNAYVTQLRGFHTLFLVDERETEKQRKRISATKQIVQDEGYPATEILVKGPTQLSRMISAIYIGDWTSYYAALQHGVDPEPVHVVEKFKKLLVE